MLVKYSDSIETSTKNDLTLDIDTISKEAGKIELQNDNERWIPTNNEIENIEKILSSKIETQNDDITETDSVESISNNTSEENKVNPIESNIKRLSYLSRDLNA